MAPKKFEAACSDGRANQQTNAVKGYE